MVGILSEHSESASVHFPIEPLKPSHDVQDVVIEPEMILAKRTSLSDTISGDSGVLHDVYYHELDSSTSGVCVVAW